MKLSQAKLNKKYIISKIAGDNNICRRLTELGFAAGSEIFAAMKAPFGGTTLVALRGQLIALRDNAADSIILEQPSK